MIESSVVTDHFGSGLICNRLSNALTERKSCYQYNNTISLAVSIKDDNNIIELIENGIKDARVYVLATYRPSSRHIDIGDDGKTHFSIDFVERDDYTSIHLSLFASEREKLRKLEEDIRNLFEPYLVTDSLFSMKWMFMVGGKIEEVNIEESNKDILQDAAYPTLTCGVKTFIDSYLDSDESVLILLGPPGTGKTRLVRAILSAMTERKQQKTKNNYNVSASVVFTMDTRLLESSSIFVEFISNKHDALVVEDIDNTLKSRENGSDNMHNFLTAADGIIQANKKKMIFSTNLPNISDIDGALLRPGRCFGLFKIGYLSYEEALNLYKTLNGTKDELSVQTHYTVADVYKLINQEAKNVVVPIVSGKQTNRVFGFGR